MNWGSAGLKDLLCNCDVYAEGTMDMILQGKDFNRGIRVFFVAYEVLSQTIFENFLLWMEQNSM